MLIEIQISCNMKIPFIALYDSSLAWCSHFHASARIARHRAVLFQPILQRLTRQEMGPALISQFCEFTRAHVSLVYLLVS